MSSDVSLEAATFWMPFEVYLAWTCALAAKLSSRYHAFIPARLFVVGMGLAELLALYAHLVAAIIFVGGSLFIWLALLPGLSGLSDDVKNQVLVKVTKRFGRVVDASLAVLVATGLYNATWYLGGFGWGSLGAKILFVKSVLALAMIFTIYFNNLYFGRRISATVRELGAAKGGEERERLRSKLSMLRRRSRFLSYTNIALMLIVVLLAVMLQMPP